MTYICKKKDNNNNNKWHRLEQQSYYCAGKYFISREFFSESKAEKNQETTILYTNTCFCLPI